jgi:hypothetical protein
LREERKRGGRERKWKRREVGEVGADTKMALKLFLKLFWIIHKHDNKWFQKEKRAAIPLYL